MSESADAGEETTSHDLDPTAVYPSSHVGAHDDPTASVDVHSGPGTPFAMGPEASQTHVARDRLSQPTQLCVPTRLKPVAPSHVGTHVEPCHSASVHDPALPPTMNAASQLPSARIHARAGPSAAAAEATNVPAGTSEHAAGVESKPQLTYLECQAAALVGNMPANVVTLETSHARTSWLNLVAAARRRRSGGRRVRWVSRGFGGSVEGSVV